MSKLRVTVNAKGLDTKLLSEQAIRDALRGVGYKYMLQVRKRTERGESVDGGTFKPYSPKYEERKTLAGRMGRNYWLRMTGQMMSSMIVSVVGRMVTVTFEGTRMVQSFRRKGPSKARPLTFSDRPGGQVSNALIAWANNRIRPFVGVNQKELAELRDFLRRTLAKAIRSSKTQPA
uniref:Tail protein n=1 Tax=viral metagenome TaxID=1070528 RepID=A0A6M3XGZ3_9ZZZZ